MHPSTAITWDGAPSDTQQPGVKSNANHSVVVAYLPQTSKAYSGSFSVCMCGCVRVCVRVCIYKDLCVCVCSCLCTKGRVSVLYAGL
jgi:hypothetical protein